MEHHPLLEELLQFCSTHNVEPAKAYNTFEVYQELSEVRKLADLNYFFNEELKLFYLSGKRVPTDKCPGIYVPMMYNDELTPQQIDTMQEILSADEKQIYLFIRDRDSSSTCYCITRGLVKPDSPNTCRKKKELEQKKFEFNKNIQSNKKFLYTKALIQKKAKQDSKKQ